jgi:hypothetical protein
MWKNFTHWLKLVLALREPTEAERVREMRVVANRMRPYDQRLSRELEIMADKAEADLETK